MKLKTHLQYERNFCTLMQQKGFHTERVAASGRRRKSVCDVILFTFGAAFMVEVKSTKQKVYFVQQGLHGIVETCAKHGIPPLIAVYFKSSHSSRGPGRWVIKRITQHLQKVTIHDQSDNL